MKVSLISTKILAAVEDLIIMKAISTTCSEVEVVVDPTFLKLFLADVEVQKVSRVHNLSSVVMIMNQKLSFRWKRHTMVPAGSYRCMMKNYVLL